MQFRTVWVAQARSQKKASTETYLPFLSCLVDCKLLPFAFND